MELATAPIDGRWTIELSLHAIKRFRERFCPALDLVGAEGRLVEVLDHAQLEPDAPSWVVPNARHTDAYLVLGDMALPLVRIPDGALLALTCVPRGGITSGARARRNRPRRRR